jgi:hypothetical protein
MRGPFPAGAEGRLWAADGTACCRSFRSEMPKLAPGVLRPWSQPFRQVPPEMKAVQASPQQGLKNTCETQVMRMPGRKQRLPPTWAGRVRWRRVPPSFLKRKITLRAGISIAISLRGLAPERTNVFPSPAPHSGCAGHRQRTVGPARQGVPGDHNLRERPGYRRPGAAGPSGP